MGVVHHVCGEHEWAGGACLHGKLDEINKTPLSKGSKAMESLRKVLLDKKLMDSLQFYTRFRLVFFYLRFFQFTQTSKELQY